jgi:hypothetical protein
MAQGAIKKSVGGQGNTKKGPTKAKTKNVKKTIQSKDPSIRSAQQMQKVNYENCRR